MKRRVSLSWLFFLGYGVLLLVITAVIEVRRSDGPSGLVAARRLEANHLLQAADISTVSGEQQYVTRAIDPREPLKAGDTSSFPSISFKGGEWPLAIPLDRELMVKGVNAGTTVRICKAGLGSPPAAQVRAVFCPPADGQCLAIVALAPAKPEDVTGLFTGGSQPFLRALTHTPQTDCK